MAGCPPLVVDRASTLKGSLPCPQLPREQQWEGAVPWWPPCEAPGWPLGGPPPLLAWLGSFPAVSLLRASICRCFRLCPPACSDSQALGGERQVGSLPPSLLLSGPQAAWRPSSTSSSVWATTGTSSSCWGSSWRWSASPWTSPSPGWPAVSSVSWPQPAQARPGLASELGSTGGSGTAVGEVALLERQKGLRRAPANTPRGHPLGHG